MNVDQVGGVTRPVLERYLADLQRADLTGADLRFATLTRARLQGADLTGAKLEEVRDLPRQPQPGS